MYMIKSGDDNILRHLDPSVVKPVDHTQCHEIVGAYKGIWNLISRIQPFVHHIGALIESKVSLYCVHDLKAVLRKRILKSPYNNEPSLSIGVAYEGWFL